MSATGLDVFDRTLQATNIWLKEIMEVLGPDRQIAWRALGAVLRATRDRLPVDLAAHLGAELPLLVRGTYYDQWQPAHAPDKTRTLEPFLERIAADLSDLRPINTQDAVGAVFAVLAAHIDAGQVAKVVDALPADLRRLWPRRSSAAA